MLCVYTCFMGMIWKLSSYWLMTPGTYPTAHIGGNGIPPTGKAGKWSTFEVVMRGASESNISVEIHGPSKPEVDVNYHSSESATVRYCLEQPGEYYITVLFNNQPINGCPFKTVIAPTEQGPCTVANTFLLCCIDRVLHF